jgi:hypothetical protein
MIRFYFQRVLIGLLATLSMDLLSAVAAKFRLTSPLPPRLIGRWFALAASGKPFHTNIANAPPVPHELLIAAAGHYTIGVLLTSVYLAAASHFSWRVRSLGAVLPFAISTTLFPWLLMLPAMGYGLAGRSAPDGLALTSLINHAFFGFGIWASIRVLGL